MSLKPKRPIAVDLFAGVGGLSLGFEQAGFDVVAAVEVDPVHAAAHAYNFPNTAIICRDVKKVTGADIRRASGIGRRRVDVVVGGAPCQGFSMIGQRVLDDPRNALVKEFVRLVVELEAKYFVFENVKGLTVGRHKQFLEALISAFRKAGYDVALPWKVLNAADFGVPQHRQRLFLMGAIKGLALPKYPTPDCSPADAIQNVSLKRGPSCGNALGDIPNAEDYESLIFSDTAKVRLAKPSKYAAELRCMEARHWHAGYRRKWDSAVLSASLRTEHTAISRRRFAATAPGQVEPISRFLKLSADGLSNTLRAGTDAARGAFTSPRPVHYLYPRCITVREMARLHGFPDWFRFHVTKWHGARQVGNSVPPPLARAVATSIIGAMQIAPVRPRQTIALGDPEFLKMDMGAAAAYWNIEVPVARRDRKSGNKKRRQEEIPFLSAAE